jgi:hypothetical protein
MYGATTFKGKFKPKYPEKYLGDVNNIVFRSSWERRMFRYCDETPGVIQWASEEFHIPYLSPVDNHPHRYFPDLWLKVQTANGLKAYVIEIKPKDQTVMPQPKKRRTRRYMTEVAAFAVNQAKWEAAEEYCKNKGWKFIVLNEDHLFEKFK